MQIKTYIRFADPSMSSIDWAMVTSANLSTQAWGQLAKDNEIRVCSWEIGVVVWPGLFLDDANDATAPATQPMTMIPSFKQDLPIVQQADSRAIGFRMPYDLPLVPYHPSEIPWCAADAHTEPDWKGVVWTGWHH